MRQIHINHTYRHFKGDYYFVTDVVKHSETREDYVVYRHLFSDGAACARPLSMFLSEVDHDKYPYIKQKYRFQEVNFADVYDRNHINPQLKSYIERKILPEYSQNEEGHGIKHIRYVIQRSFGFADFVSDINYDMVYAIAAYHDLAHHIDAKNHEKLSADLLQKDQTLRKFFNEKQIKIMSEAVYDHRASMSGEPRSIYGKIVSSADRDVDIETPFKRTYSYRKEHTPDASLDDMIEESRQHLKNKYGKNSYAKDKMYFPDEGYANFLQKIDELTNDKAKFKQEFLRINQL